jgi:autotransporter adhesin
MNVSRSLKFQPWKVLPAIFAVLFPLTSLSAPSDHVDSSGGIVRDGVAASSSSPVAAAATRFSPAVMHAASASGVNSVAVGSGASASAENAVAVGNTSSATSDNSVALGANAVADRGNSVSVGSLGNERQITNVAAGTADTDVANVGQVNAGVQQAVNWADSYTDQRATALGNQIRRVDAKSSAGVAGAMAMAGLPQAYEAGKTAAAVAVGSFRSQSGMAIGVSTISENGRMVYKATGSSDSRGNTGMTIGAGVQW